MTDYAAVLTRNYPGAEWSLNGDDYAGLVWHDESPKPTKAELDGAWPAVRDGLAWDRVRWAEYRQQLRDIPQDFASPDDVVWPAAP